MMKDGALPTTAMQVWKKLRRAELPSLSPPCTALVVRPATFMYIIALILLEQ
jgi:hypothetical protein